MGLFGKNKDGKSGERRNILKNAMRSSDLKVAVSHADLEGMLSTIGVIAALVLSIQVGVFCTIPQEEMALADYRIALIEVPPFRAYALSILEKLDDPPFKFEVDVGQDTPFDIQQPSKLSMFASLLSMVGEQRVTTRKIRPSST